MQIENLTDYDVNLLQRQVEELKRNNPEIKSKVYQMEDMDFSKRLTAIEENIAELNRKLDLIFGGHVLIKGRFVDHEADFKQSLKKGGFNHR